MPRFPSPRMSLFCALSAADFLLTWWLLHRSNGRVYEANPVAAGLLVELGWAGLAAFKVVVVLLAVGSIAAIARAGRGWHAGSWVSAARSCCQSSDTAGGWRP